VLDILADALDDNNVKYRMLHASRKFEVTNSFMLFLLVADVCLNVRYGATQYVPLRVPLIIRNIKF